MTYSEILEKAGIAFPEVLENTNFLKLTSNLPMERIDNKEKHDPILAVQVDKLNEVVQVRSVLC